MRRKIALLGMLVLGSFAGAFAQDTAPGYKLGMFTSNGRTFVGLVLDDAVVLDLNAAGNVYPATLRGLIESWDGDVAAELAALAANARAGRAANTLELAQLRILPPLDDPDAILMAARNYVEHAEEMYKAGRTAGTTRDVDANVQLGLPGAWIREPTDERPNPYLFPKLKSALAANGDPIILPPGRGQIDYECELIAVIGRTAQRVAVGDALDYVFGYMAMVDVSDREERADGRYGSDWFMGKSHDSFAPVGPFVVPAGFVGDPQDLDLRYTLNGTVMQDANTALMVHTVRDLVSFASHITTLRPGDLIGSGTPGGVGAGREPPVYLKDGDTGVCWIERIGALTNSVTSASKGGR